MGKYNCRTNPYCKGNNRITDYEFKQILLTFLDLFELFNGMEIDHEGYVSKKTIISLTHPLTNTFCIDLAQFVWPVRFL